MKMSMDQMIEEVAKLCANFPHPPHTHAQIELKAILWLHDIGGTQAGDFIEACRIHRMESSQFPTIHDLIEKVRTIVNHRAMRTPQIEEVTEACTPEESAKFARDIRTLIKRNALKSVRGGRKR